MKIGRNLSAVAIVGALGIWPALQVTATDPAPATPNTQKTQSDGTRTAPSRDSLFEDAAAPADKSTSTAWKGFIQGEVAYAYDDPAHWSKQRLRLELNRQGKFSENVKWKIGGRLDYDAAYDSSNFYAPQVQQDQRYGFTSRE